MAFLPPFEVLFPLSDDVRGMVECVCEAGEIHPMVVVPQGFLSARDFDFGVMEFPAEGTH